MIRSRIIGTGRAVPPKVLTNADLGKMVDTSDAWIVERTGIRERHILDPSLAASDLATEAGGRRAARRASTPATVDCIIVGTVTADCPVPGHRDLRAEEAGRAAGRCAFDLSAACAGFLYGLSIADASSAPGSSSTCWWSASRCSRASSTGPTAAPACCSATARARCCWPPTTGGGAASCRRTSTPTARWPSSCCMPAGGSREPLTPGGHRRQAQHFVKMNGREVYKHAVRNMAAAAKTALEANGLTARRRRPGSSPIRPTCASSRACPSGSEFRWSASSSTSSRYGNTSSASVPTALDEAIAQDKLNEGDILLFTALGGGLAWASAAVRW